jgi:dihydroorotate dehydrogenase (NAD+) catalytic subunit
LDNPIIPASGTFGFGAEHTQFYDLNILGSIALKAITVNPRYGNDVPRICEAPSGMINSIGLQNSGVDHIIQFYFPLLTKVFKKKVIANIAATTIEDYVTLVKKLNHLNNIAIFEVNVSCPNVDKGCMKFDSDPNSLTLLIKTLKKMANKPLYIKLSPQVNDIVLMAKTAENAGADGLVLINTVPGMRIDLNYGKPIMANKIGGLSGPAIKPMALRAVFLCSQNVNIPIIGCGGVSNAEDVIEIMYAGATAVQIGSENLINPYACKNIINDLPNVMKTLKIKKLTDIIGKS